MKIKAPEKDKYSISKMKPFGGYVEEQRRERKSTKDEYGGGIREVMKTRIEEENKKGRCKNGRS